MCAVCKSQKSLAEPYVFTCNRPSQCCIRRVAEVCLLLTFRCRSCRRRPRPSGPTQTGLFWVLGRIYGEKMKGYIALPHREDGRDIAIHRQRHLRSHTLASFIMLFTGLPLCKIVFWRRQSDSSAVDQAFGPLQFQPDGTFQLSIFEDLHFGEGELLPRPHPPRKDIRSQ